MPSTSHPITAKPEHLIVIINNTVQHKIKKSFGAQLLGYLKLVITGRRGRYDVIFKFIEGARANDLNASPADCAHFPVLLVELMLFPQRFVEL